MYDGCGYGAALGRAVIVALARGLSKGDNIMTDAAQQHWQADTYQQHTGFVPILGAPVLELLAPKAGERILDLGCGDGALTEQIKEAGVDVLGVDASSKMIDAARERGLDVRVQDAQQLDFKEDFDAVFSNAALHWMLNPDAVIAGVHDALKPGGRFVAEFGGHGNVAAIATALLAVVERRGIDGVAISPWYFPTPDAYRARLVEHGFEIVSIDLISRPTPLPTDMEGWLQTMAGTFFAALEPGDRPAALAETIRLLAPSLRDEGGNWTADYVRLRFHAKRVA